MNTTKIRRATEADTNLIATIGAKSFFDTFDGTCTRADMQQLLNDFFNTTQVRSELIDATDYFYIMYVNDIAVGYCRMNAKDETPIKTLQKAIELKRIYFLKEYITHGYGNTLLQYAEHEAKQMGYENMYLGVWEYNFKAKGFYIKNGFQDSGLKHAFPIGNTPQTDHWYYKQL